jgi:tetratricopeptide (TPR) repeat protein
MSGGLASGFDMARRVLDVFLSSTAKDLEPYRDAVHARLMRTGLFHCVRQENFGAQDAGAIDFCRQKAQAADLFVGLVGLRRGWEPDGDKATRSITEMEHDFAKEAGRRRYIWVAPDDFPVPGNIRESDAEHGRQGNFRKRVMAGGERIVSQKGFGSPELLASEIVEHLLAQVVTGDLIALLRPEFSQGKGPSAEEQRPAVAAAVGRLSSDDDVDLLALAKRPEGVDLRELEVKLKARAEAQEVEGQRALKQSAEYWRHIGALAFLHDTPRALAAYDKAVTLDPEEAEGWRYLGELRYWLGDFESAAAAFITLQEIGIRLKNKRIQCLAGLRLGWIHREKGDLLAANAITVRSLELAEGEGWMEGMAMSYGNLGILGGDLAAAEEMLLKSLKLFQELGNNEGVAKCYCNLGNAYSAHGDLAKAEKMHLTSLKLYEQLGQKGGAAIVYGNLGMIYRRRGDLQKAEETLLKSLLVSEELGAKYLIARLYENLGIIYEGKNDTKRMCEYWRKARDLCSAIGWSDRGAEIEQWLRDRRCDKH